jgi:CDGSH-type Zn-finger protein
MEAENKKTGDIVVEVVDGEQLKISGPIVLKDLKRDIILNLEEVSLCLCGRSRNKPYCDNSHLLPAENKE